jgi:hypothetical protein
MPRKAAPLAQADAEFLPPSKLHVIGGKLIHTWWYSLSNSIPTAFCYPMFPRYGRKAPVDAPTTAG